MKIDKKNEGDCRVRLTITAPAEETAETYGKILNTFMRNAQLRGFRKGKAPKDVILRVFGPQIDAEAKRALCSDLIDKAVAQEGLEVAAIVGARDVTLSPGNGIEFTAFVDVEPTFKAPKYKGLPLKFNAPAVSDDELEKQLTLLRETFDTTAESAEPMKDGDYANISFESDLVTEGAAADDPAARYVKNENFWLQVGEKPYYEAIPGSAKALVGLKAGDDFSFETSFADDFHVESLRGKKGSYKGKVMKVNAVVHASDEDFCKGVQAASLDEIRDRLRQRMLAEREQQERSRLHDEIDALFTKKATFDVPGSSVQVAARAIGERVISREIQGNVKGQSEVESYVRDHAEELRAKIDAEATNYVRLNYIGRVLAKELDITATENDVRALADAEAQAYSRRDPSITGEKIFARIKKDGEVGYYQDRLRYSRVVDWIIDNDLKPAAK